MTRTPKQIAAEDLLRGMTKIAQEAIEFAVNYDEPSVREAGHQVAALRTRVRAHMHPRDREEASCPVCNGSGIEYVYAGHGNINEDPCSSCRSKAEDV